MTPTVTVVIPAYQEGDSIVPVLERIGASVSSVVEIVVVADFAADSTAAAVARLGLLRTRPEAHDSQGRAKAQRIADLNDRS